MDTWSFRIFSSVNDKTSKRPHVTKANLLLFPPRYYKIIQRQSKKEKTDDIVALLRKVKLALTI